MTITSFPTGATGFGGILLREVPMFDMIPGNVYWVHSGTGGAGNPGTFARPLSTIAGAVAKCTANQNDVIFCKPGHAETLTSSLALSTAGVNVIGIGSGTLRPTLTGNGTIDAVTISAANVRLQNFLFAAPETDAQTADINVTAAGAHILGTRHIGSQTAKNKVDIITLASGANDTVIDGVRIYNSAVEIVGGIALEATVARCEIRNSQVIDTIGITNGALYDAAIASHLLVENCLFQNAKAGTVVVSFATNSTGVIRFCHVSGRHTTLASNIAMGTGMDAFEVRVTEQAALNGAIIPAADTD